MKEIFALRVELEGYAAGQAARHATPEQIVRLARARARDGTGCVRIGREPDDVRITEANNCFHG